MHTDPVSKDLMFKMRLDADDRARLDDLAKHYSAPAATVVRILVKEKHEDVMSERLRTRTNAEAQGYARVAHEQHFESRRGMFETEEEETDRAVFFDNNPYRWRAEEHSKLRQFMAANGMKIVGEASYPPSGESAAYTTAWIVTGDAKRFEAAMTEWQRIIGETLALSGAPEAKMAAVLHGPQAVTSPDLPAPAKKRQRKPAKG